MLYLNWQYTNVKYSLTKMTSSDNAKSMSVSLGTDQQQKINDYKSTFHASIFLYKYF